MRLSLIILVSMISFARGANEINILVVGNAGAGKSSLINFLMDEQLAAIGVDTTGTTDVNVYSITKYGNRFHFYDTPGLNDLENTANIPMLVAGKVRSMNIIVFCLDLSAPRLYSTDLSMIAEYQKRFGRAIMNNAIVVFTKSNLVRDPFAIGEKRKAVLLKQTGQVPYLYSYSLDREEQDPWVNQMWLVMAKHSSNNAYMMQSSYYKINLCDPMNKIMARSSQNMYPSHTDQAVTNSYNDCVMRHEREQRMKAERNAAGFGLLAFVGFIALTVVTGGGAAVMGGLAAAGGGSLAAGGLGVAGGSLLIATLGATSGIAMTEYHNHQCISEVAASMQYQINQPHHDVYMYANGATAFAGMFRNNKPNGYGMAYTIENEIIWQGQFTNGRAEICKGIA